MVHINIMSLSNLLDYSFMRYGLAAGSFAAVLAGITGYFMALRQLTFAGHALSHVGFAGAVAAGLLHFSPLLGQLLITLLAALGIGGLGERLTRNDFVIGIILAFSLGLGVLFLHFSQGYAGRPTAILFGDILGVSVSALRSIGFLTLACLLFLGIIARPLVFSSIEPELAQAKGLSPSRLTTFFLIISAVAVTLASQVVGVLLVFTLLVGPAAIALHWTRQFWTGIALSVLIALLSVWIGIILSYLTDWPVSFWICSLVFAGYLPGLFAK